MLLAGCAAIGRRSLSLLLVLLFLPAIAMRAQEQDRQHAQDPSSFWTKQQIIAQGINAGVRSFDIAQSCAHPNYREVGGPWQSCLGITAWVGAGIPEAIGIGYLLHRMHHDKLAQWAPYFGTAQSAGSVAYSYHSYSISPGRRQGK